MENLIMRNKKSYLIFKPNSYRNNAMPSYKLMYVYTCTIFEQVGQLFSSFCILMHVLKIRVISNVRRCPSWVQSGTSHIK